MKSVFITGAASGIGLATARRFAGHGWRVGLYDINREGLAELMTDSLFANSHSGFCDVSDRSSIEAALADFAAGSDGKIPLVVNNAGVLSAGPFTGIDANAHDLMIDVNVRGFTHVAQLAFPYLEGTPGACLVNLCSASSIHGIPNLAVYSATKFYVNAMTQALHIEWANHGIRVTCVKPHLVDTRMARDVQDKTTGESKISLTPDDIAAAIERAVNGSRVSYVLGDGASTWALLDKLLPERLRIALTRRLIGSQSQAH
ncbi:MAG: SDR family oxidoreductase [Halieaceae bacterium]|nr:SDR family oxidoreductase [Halieaceae bacterium]